MPHGSKKMCYVGGHVDTHLTKTPPGLQMSNGKVSVKHERQLSLSE